MAIKTAGVGSAWQKAISFFGTPVGGAVAAAGVTAGVGLATHGAAKLYQAVDRSKKFKQMVEMNPELRNHDADMVHRYYKTMYSVSPHLARDPYLSGAWVQQALENAVPGHAHIGLYAGVHQLSGIQKNLTDARRPGMGQEIAKQLGEGTKQVSGLVGKGLDTKKQIGEIVRGFDAEMAFAENQGAQWTPTQVAQELRNYTHKMRDH